VRHEYSLPEPKHSVMPHIYTLPASLAFRGKGLFGYSFGPLNERGVEVLYIESETGHDTFMISRGVTRIYYILSGTGSFTINGREFGVRPGVLVEAPAGVEYSYSGRMTMLAFCKRRLLRRKDRFTKWNRNVVGAVEPWALGAGSLSARLIRVRILGKSPANAFLRVNQRLWNMLPGWLTALRPIEWYGHCVHALARVKGDRAQAFNTYFLRNRAELELIQRAVTGRKHADTLRVAVLGCSCGPEAYSVAWAIRKARPDLNLMVHGVDVSKEAIELARRGVYSLTASVGVQEVRDYGAAGRWRVALRGSELVGAEIFDRMTEGEKAELFDVDGDNAAVKSWIREGIDWHVGDVKAPEILDALGPQDVVVASNFLCHMVPAEAERCLRNIARLVSPYGYLFVSGIDLDVRTNVAQDLGWKPMPDLLERIHDGDPCLRAHWPWHYGGLEPLDKRRRDWRTRYAAAFQIVPGVTVPRSQSDGALAGSTSGR
jgi:chemotaxis methyl-accepting protein methylase